MPTPFRAIMLAALVLTAIAVGCSPTSKEPLSGEENSKLDKRLLGKWQDNWDAEAGANRVKPKGIEIQRKAGSATGLELTEFPKQPGAVDKLPFYTTKVGDYGYLTFDAASVGINPADGKPHYYIHQYRFLDDDTLDLYAMDDKVIAHAIAKGELKGSYLGGHPNNAKFVSIADSRDNLRRYLEKHGDDCYLDRSVRLTRRQK